MYILVLKLEVKDPEIIVKSYFVGLYAYIHIHTVSQTSVYLSSVSVVCVCAFVFHL